MIISSKETYRLQTCSSIGPWTKGAIIRYVLAIALILVASLESSAGMRECVEPVRASNFEQALREFRSSADKGDATAQACLGFLELQSYYEKAESSPESAKQQLSIALKWLDKAAAQNEPFGLLVLGTLYLEGSGPVKDAKKGLSLIEAAANQNDVPAQLELAKMYEAGRLLPKSSEEALKWWVAAAKNGSFVGRHSAAVYYNNGLAGPADRVKAYAWAKLGADQGYQLAKSLQYQLDQELKPEEIAEGERVAIECVSKEFVDCGL